jgi:hypothetical protein
VANATWKPVPGITDPSDTEDRQILRVDYRFNEFMQLYFLAAMAALTKKKITLEERDKIESVIARHHLPQFIDAGMSREQLDARFYRWLTEDSFSYMYDGRERKCYRQVVVSEQSLAALEVEFQIILQEVQEIKRYRLEHGQHNYNIPFLKKIADGTVGEMKL